MKVIQTSRQIERRRIIFRRRALRVRQQFYFGSLYMRTPGYLILGVLAKFSGIYYSRTPVNGSPVQGHIKRRDLIGRKTAEKAQV